MGEKVYLVPLTYTVFETQWMTQLGEEPNVRIPQHRFFLVRVTMGNSSSADVLAPNLVLQDDKGNQYTELSNGDDVPQWIGFLREIKATDTLQGIVIFDVPPTHYKLRLADPDGTRAALVDIPLNFNAETPEIPTPGGIRKQDTASPTILRRPQ